MNKKTLDLMLIPNLKSLKSKRKKKFFSLKNKVFVGLLLIFISSFFGFLAGAFSISLFNQGIEDIAGNLKAQISQEESPEVAKERSTISAVNKVSPSVVSIIVTKDLPVIEKFYISPFQDFPIQIPQYRQKGTEKQEVGGGTGFIISSDGLVLTNKHVVSVDGADYTVLTNKGKSYDAEVLAKDPGQDLAILKINTTEIFPSISLGNSDNLKIGQTVIAIGNALGEFRNTVSVGVISGLGRTITAEGGGIIETISDVIQTDAAINKGNSGGPLVNLAGEVIGINTATAIEAQSIGFAISINKAKRAIKQVKTIGKIVYPFLGIRYVLITEDIQKESDLSVDYGAWVVKGSDPGDVAISPGSAAEEIGLREGDIILEFNGEKITINNTLAKIIMKYNPGDTVSLRVLRNNKETIFQATLGEKSS
ncbi:S1C family serine protease [Patescibacteria group bacterium]